jgi:hypothetical protein
MSENSYLLVLTRIAVALERLAEQPSPSAGATRARRRSKAASSDSTSSAGTTASTGDAPASIDVEDDAAMRLHAGERIKQLVAQAGEAGCTITDIEETISDVVGSADPATLELTALSQVIVGLTRLIRSQATPAEESETDKQTRAEALAQLRTLITRASATDDGVTRVTAILRDHAEGRGDVEGLELGKLQALLAIMQVTINSTAPVA